MDNLIGNIHIKEVGVLWYVCVPRVLGKLVYIATFSVQMIGELDT